MRRGGGLMVLNKWRSPRRNREAPAAYPLLLGLDAFRRTRVRDVVVTIAD
jgi:hypothetical protein